MRAFAEFVMRGRVQATGICVAFGIAPFLHWVATAVVALVVLRRGVAEGSLLVLWTTLPLIAWYLLNNDSSPLLALLGAFALACVLRVTVSWEMTLTVVVAVAAVSSLVFEVASPDVLGEIVKWYMDVLSSMKQQLSQSEAQQVLVGFFSVGQAFAMILAVALGRWWQSTLYNPGGFQKEFHQLRLSPAISVALVAVMIGLFAMQDPAFGRWIPLLTVPMVIPAIALVHWLVKERKLSSNFLVAFYVLFLLLIQLLYPLLASLALFDSWMNLRAKFGSVKPDDEV